MMAQLFTMISQSPMLEPFLENVRWQFGLQNRGEAKELADYFSQKKAFLGKVLRSAEGQEEAENMHCNIGKYFFRNDKDVLDYLIGRYHAVPVISTVAQHWR